MPPSCQAQSPALTGQTGGSAYSRPLMDIQTSLSTVSSPLMWREQHRGQLSWSQSWLMTEVVLVLWNRYMELSSSQSISQVSFHLVLPTTKRKLRLACNLSCMNWGAITLMQTSWFYIFFLVPQWAWSLEIHERERNTIRQGWGLRKTTHQPTGWGTDRLFSFWSGHGKVGLWGEELMTKRESSAFLPWWERGLLWGMREGLSQGQATEMLTLARSGQVAGSLWGPTSLSSNLGALVVACLGQVT